MIFTAGGEAVRQILVLVRRVVPAAAEGRAVLLRGADLVSARQTALSRNLREREKDSLLKIKERAQFAEFCADSCAPRMKYKIYLVLP